MEYREIYYSDVKEYLNLDDRTARAVLNDTEKRFNDVSELSSSQITTAKMLYGLTLGFLIKSGIRVGIKQRDRIKDVILDYIKSGEDKDSFITDRFINFFTTTDIEKPGFGRVMAIVDNYQLTKTSTFEDMMNNLISKSSVLSKIVPRKVYEEPTPDNITLTITDVLGVDIYDEYTNKERLDYILKQLSNLMTYANVLEGLLGGPVENPMKRFTEDLLNFKEQSSNLRYGFPTQIWYTEQRLIRQFGAYDDTYSNKLIQFLTDETEVYYDKVMRLLEQDLGPEFKEMIGKLSFDKQVEMVGNYLEIRDHIFKNYQVKKKSMEHIKSLAFLLSYVKTVLPNTVIDSDLIDEVIKYSISEKHLGELNSEQLTSILTAIDTMGDTFPSHPSTQKEDYDQEYNRTLQNINRTILRFIMKAAVDPRTRERAIRYAEVWTNIQEKFLKPYTPTMNITAKMNTLIKANRAFWAYVISDLVNLKKPYNYGWKYGIHHTDCYDFASVVTRLSDSIVYDFYHGRIPKRLKYVKDPNELFRYMTSIRNWTKHESGRYINAREIREVRLDPKDDSKVSYEEVGSYIFWRKSPHSENNHHGILTIDENGNLCLVDFGYLGKIRRDPVYVRKQTVKDQKTGREQIIYYLGVSNRSGVKERKINGSNPEVYIRDNRVSENL